MHHASIPHIDGCKICGVLLTHNRPLPSSDHTTQGFQMPQTPKIKLKNIQELAKIAKEVIPVVQPYIVKYAPKIAEEAQKRASNAADNGKRMKLEFLNGMEEKKNQGSEAKRPKKPARKRSSVLCRQSPLKNFSKTSRTTFLTMASSTRVIWDSQAVMQLSQ